MTSRHRDASTHLDSGSEWIDTAYDDIVPVLRQVVDPGCRCGVTGSVATGSVDDLSDLDLVVITSRRPDPVEAMRCLAAHGPLWSVDVDDAEDGLTVRAYTRAGRHLDLLVRHDEAALPSPVLWASPRSSSPPRVAGAAVDPRVGVEPAVMGIRHVAAVAATKLGREDVLIGAHLCLEVAREVLVLHMRRRDRDLGTTHHRRGGAHDDDAREVSAALAGLPAGAGPGDWLDVLVRLRDPVDSAARALVPGHTSDWQGLDAIVDRARTALAGRHN